MTDQIQEPGAAQFVANLSGGVITITHTAEDGPVLAQWTARAGDWDKLWATIDNLKTHDLSKHGKLQDILQEYNNPEWGDEIVDKISDLFNYPRTPSESGGK